MTVQDGGQGPTRCQLAQVVGESEHPEGGHGEGEEHHDRAPQPRYDQR